MPVIGELRERVAIADLVSTPTGTKDTSRSFTTLATVWASVETIDGVQALDGRNISEGPTHRFTVRWRDDVAITRKQWLVWGARQFRIESVENPNERDRWLEIVAEEVRTA
jgi:SPP1 family predicted phage head-tail adaptor